MHRDRWRRFEIVALWGCVILLGVVAAAFCTPAGASELTRGKKALFAEDFEMDIYEWTLMEEGTLTWSELKKRTRVTTRCCSQARKASWGLS